MTVADEHDGIGTERERHRRGVVGEDVLPHRVAGAAVVEGDAVPLAHGLEPVEIGPSGGREDALRPACGHGGVAAELGQVERPPHGEIVIPAQADLRTRLDERAALVRPRPVADDVAEAPELVRRDRVDRRDDCL